MRVVADGNVVVNGVIDIRGGAGGSGLCGSAGGGGGAGGSLWLQSVSEQYLEPGGFIRSGGVGGSPNGGAGSTGNYVILP